MKCDGKSDDHCCYLSEGQVCPFLKEYKEGPRRWSCGLYEKYGSWEEVYKSKEYIEEIDPEYVAISEKCNVPYIKCGEWPLPGVLCATCGKVG